LSTVNQRGLNYFQNRKNFESIDQHQHQSIATSKYTKQTNPKIAWFVVMALKTGSSQSANPCHPPKKLHFYLA
jgi:hypothetical protein